MNKDKLYQNFLESNPKKGYLKIKASAAGGAVPISGVEIEITTDYQNETLSIYKGVTDSSGIIEKISLPAPISNKDNLVAPNYTKYKLKATYKPDNIELLFNINIYEDILVFQRISIVPNMRIEVLNSNGY